MKEDFRFAIRMIRRAPAFAGTVVLTLAIGIAAASTMFSIVDQVFFRSLMYESAEQIVLVFNKYGNDATAMSPPDYVDHMTRTKAYASIGAWAPGNAVVGSESPERVPRARVTSTLLPTLGVRPEMGRWFSETEGIDGEEDVMIIGHDLWLRRFGGDPAILGRSVHVDGAAKTVIGVMPAGFSLPESKPEVFLPLAFSPDQLSDEARGNEYLWVMARLREGITVEQAAAEAAIVAASVIERVPDRASFLIGADWSATVVSVRDHVLGDLREGTTLLFISVLLVLAIACANVASLMLTRSVRRIREMGVRQALGASGLRLIRQLFTEGVVLSGVAAILGVVLAAAAMPALERMSGLTDATPVEFAIDGRAIGFSAAVALLCAIVFSLAPAFRAASREILSSLGEESRGGSTSLSGSRLRTAFVFGQIAFSVVLLVGCLLLLRSLEQLLAVDPGFQTSGRITARLTAMGSSYGEAEARRQFFQTVLDRLESIPEARAVGAVTELPLSGDRWTGTFHLEEPRPGQPAPGANLRIASSGYLDAIGIPLIEGRWFDERDAREGAPPVVVVDRVLASRYWPGQSAVGKRITFDPDEPVWREVVGVVGDIRDAGLSNEVEPHLYGPMSQRTPQTMTVVAAVDGDPSAFSGRIRETVQSIDPGLPVWALRDMESYVDGAAAQSRFRSTLFLIFATIGFLLASIGTYSVVSRALAERRRELAIRASLGASSRDLLRLAFGWTARVGVPAVVVGLLGSVAASRVLESMLFGVGPLDPVSHVAAVGLIAASLAGATWMPARHATRIAPSSALREE